MSQLGVKIEKDPWVKLCFSDLEVSEKLYNALFSVGSTFARLKKEVRLVGSDIEFERRSLLCDVEEIFEASCPNWKDRLIWICGG